MAYSQHAKPPKVAVPDEATAVRVAEKALISVYGRKKIQPERPFTAELKDAEWLVKGTLHCPGSQGGKIVCKGGVAAAKISQADGRILSMGHGK
jgi:hypothetical protein